ncbi:hypothetical protein ALMP_56270 [Streptomyces sp. A012304]|nr:hypothetical protein ALMP_56270 [Streptomyces sp. A012304]
MVPERVQVNHGTVTTTRAGRIGGMSSVPATAERPALVKLALMPTDGEERTQMLSEGETFDIGGDVYQVEEIKHHRSWTVTLRLIP